MSFRNDLKLGMSIAFSHGSANAILFGMLCIQHKGLAGFLMWAIPNAICMSIFGWLYHKKLLNERALDNRITKCVMLLFQMVYLLFQMKLLQTYFQPITGEAISFVLASTIALVFVLWMYKHGLITSIVTDNWQGYITLGSIALAVSYCFCTGVPTHLIPSSNSPDYLWGVWSSAVYTAAIICDLQHWRRADIDVSQNAFHYATGIFALLMALIAMLGIYDIPPEVRLFLVIPVLGLATSTIDSIAVALHECVNKKVGTAVAVAICLFWWIFLNKNAFFIWNSLGTIRITGALCIIFLSLWYWFEKQRADKQVGAK